MEELAKADTQKLTKEFTPNESRDVGGPQPIGGAAFFDLSSENPAAPVPDVSQFMWIHIEEPDPSAKVLDTTNSRVWFKVLMRDVTGAALMGVPERIALQLSSCSDMEEFKRKHANGELNFPLLSHVRVSRSVAPVRPHVNYNVEDLEPITWDKKSAPNQSFQQLLNILYHCPPSDEGIHFAFLEDIRPDHHYGIRLEYDGQDGPRCIYVVALLWSNTKSSTEQVSEERFKVVTNSVKDIAHPRSIEGEEPVGDYSVVGYCSVQNLAEFKLDPPRGKPRVVLALLSSADETEGFHIHKQEPVEPTQVSNAVYCLRKLRTLSKKLKCGSSEKRTHDFNLATDAGEPRDLKKARMLQVCPTDLSLKDETA